LSRRAAAILARGAIPIVVVTGGLLWLAADTMDSTPSFVARSIVVAGAGFGVVYLGISATRLLTRPKPSQAIAAEGDGHVRTGRQ
jgi:hypothetical protein